LWNRSTVVMNLLKWVTIIGGTTPWLLLSELLLSYEKSQSDSTNINYDNNSNPLESQSDSTNINYDNNSNPLESQSDSTNIRYGI
jgi:hypothetical protein